MRAGANVKTEPKSPHVPPLFPASVAECFPKTCQLLIGNNQNAIITSPNLTWNNLNNIFIWDLYSFLDVIVLKRVYK
jgi:hypothetical protein